MTHGKSSDPPEEPELRGPEDRELLDMAPPSAEERIAAEHLRDELGRAERSRGARPLDLQTPNREGLDLALAIRHAVHPTPLDSHRHEQILARALASARRRPAARRRWAHGAVGVGGTLALAAGVLLMVVDIESRDAATLDATDMPVSSMVPCRSAAELFDAQFPVTGGTSNRVDRIALSRERDLRGNLFAQWRVK